jgi:hypothetical protein
MIDYIFYRIYLVIKKSSLNDIPIFSTIVILSMFLGVNSITIYYFFRKLNVGLPNIFVHKYVGGIVVGLFILMNLIIYLFLRRGKKVISCFETESKEKRKVGKVILILYSALTITLLILVSLYKKGVT